jgi:hypothetical protein
MVFSLQMNEIVGTEDFARAQVWFCDFMNAGRKTIRLTRLVLRRRKQERGENRM